MIQIYLQHHGFIIYQVLMPAPIGLYIERNAADNRLIIRGITPNTYYAIFLNPNFSSFKYFEILHTNLILCEF